jgi:hypothetical protein
VRVVADVRSPIGQHPAPGGRWTLDTQTEKRERGLQNDDAADGMLLFSAFNSLLLVAATPAIDPDSQTSPGIGSI